MKKSRVIRLVRIGIIFALTIASLIGCGEEEKQVDYSIEGLEESEQPESEEGKIELAQFEGETDWKETWMIQTGEWEWNGQMLPLNCEVKVKAKVLVPQTKQMSVIEVAEPEFDEEFKKMIAENIFASGEIYYGDPGHLPKKDLLKIQEYYAEFGGTVTRLSTYPYSWTQPVEIREDIQAALDNIESAKGTYTLVEEYTVNEYLGLYAEHMYCVNFTEEEGSGYRRLKQITIEPKDLYELCPVRLMDVKDLTCSPWTQGNWVENECTLSEEDALKKAQEFAEQLGLDYPVVSYTYPLLWGIPPQYVNEESATETWGVNGYIFCFDLGVDDISFVNYGMYEDYRNFWNDNHEDNREIRYSTDSRLQVYVTDQGIIKAIADNPMDIVSVQEGVGLLDLETAKSMIKEAMNGLWIEPSSPSSTFDTMELIYFRVRDKQNEGKYSYIPVWRLGVVTWDAVAQDISIVDAVMINAMDGSPIDFYDET